MTKKKIQKAVRHNLKCDPVPFQAIWDGRKVSDIRFDDRNFKVGETVNFEETHFTGAQMRKGEPYILHYTGRHIEAKITHIQGFENGYGLLVGYVILSLEVLVLEVSDYVKAT